MTTRRADLRRHERHRVRARGAPSSCAARRHGCSLLARIPAGRFGSLPEIAAVVDFLLSPDAAYMTGSVVSLDGGSSI